MREGHVFGASLTLRIGIDECDIDSKRKREIEKEDNVLTIYDPGFGAYCDGITRRGFLHAGTLALGGLTLGDILRLRAESPLAGTPRPKSVIMIYLSGGPSHLDMYDMKPEAPQEYRGEFRPIRTNVPGMDVCELMPMQAKIADKFAILRGVQFAHLHTGNEFYSGYPWQDFPRVSVPGEARRPALGSIVSRLRAGGSVIPQYVSLNNGADWEHASYVGLEHEPLRVGDGITREPLDNMRWPRDVSAERMANRGDLLRAVDTLRRDLDHTGTMAGMDVFQVRALQMVTSGAVRDAFDLTIEPESIRNRYGERPFNVVRQECNTISYQQIKHPGRLLLQARRLVEAGVSVVTCGYHNWDTHRYNFTTLRQLLPPLDQALSALILDLEQRGMLQDVAVLMGGEFGRTPRVGDITPDGRSHWAEAGFLWVAGGGLRTGQVIGVTDARGERVIGNPIRMQNVLATLYRVLGIDPAMTFPDYNGRPQYVLENREPVRDLL